MSYWSNKPVSVINNKCKGQILSNKELYKLIINDETLKKFNINFNYKVLSNPENLLIEKKNQIVDFINKNYKSKNEEISLYYTTNLIDYFITSDTLIIEFYTLSNLQVGLIMGKKEKIILNKEIEDFLEVNFLCLNQNLRNLHASSIMINILIKECIERFNIGIAHYTIGNKIKSESFCTKRIFHRPININNLLNNNFFGNLQDTNESLFTLIDKFNNWRETTNSLLYINGKNYETNNLNLDYLYNDLCKFRNNNYKIHDYISKNDFIKLFINDSFHNFIFKNKDKIYAYFCFYNFKNINNITGNTYENAFLYKYFINNNKGSHDKIISQLLEHISKKFYDLGTIDTLSLCDNFTYKFKNWINGTGSLKYYLFNKYINKIEPYENGLVTI